MTPADLISNITDIISDASSQGFSYSDTNEIPNVATPGLTYESGDDKKGKKIETCVLYVDIRDSVKLTEVHDVDIMGKIYTAFTKSVLKIADNHGGKVRNIIGDRVMVVFPETDCFTNAVDCAISINHASIIINSTFPGVNFKCGIGIDYGEMRVLKVGIEKRGEENQDNKNLVWVGSPANLASRLTDTANKSISKDYYSVTRNQRNLFSGRLGLGQSHPFFASDIIIPEFHEETVEMTPEKFASIVECSATGQFQISEGEYLRHEKKSNKVDYPPILMTESVFEGFKSANSTRNCIRLEYWKEVDSVHIKNVKQKVYGGRVIWKLD